MDLAKLNTTVGGEKGAKLHLRHPATDEYLYVETKEKDENGKKKKLPITITLLGSDSNEYRRLLAESTKKAQSRRGRLSKEDTDALVCATIAGATVGWENLSFNGEEKAFSRAEAESVYLENIWIREQVTEFINDRANFLPKA